MHTELVERRRWISEKRFLHALNYCMLLPGPEAQQLATYIGWLMHRTWGGIVAGALFVSALAVHPDCAVVDLPRLRRRAGGCGPVLRHQACRDSDRPARGAPHRLAGAQEQLAVGHCRGVFHGHLRADRAIPGHRCCRGPDRRTSGAVSRPTNSGPAAVTARPKSRSGPALIDDDTPTPEHAAIPLGRGSPGWSDRRRAVGRCRWVC